MSTRTHAVVAAVLMLAFATETPAPDNQAPAEMREGGRVSAAAPVDVPLITLIQTQTDVINDLNVRVKAIEKRLEALEKEKNNG